MRKLTVILLFATLCITKMQADTFLVYAFSGDVCSTKGKIHTTDKFSSKEVLTLGSDAALTLLNTTTRQKITVKGKGKGSIADILGWGSTSITSTKDTYWKWLMTQMRKSDKSMPLGENYTTTFRDAEVDSLFTDTLTTK